MSFVISSLIPFPNIYWWCQLSKAEKLVLDLGERYQKMSYRNRYYIAGANGVLMLSVPIKTGRNNRAPVKEVAISYHEAWQRQQWRTLFSAYNRSPFFEFYAGSLEALFRHPFQRLADFNLASIRWCMEQTGMDVLIEEAEMVQEDLQTAADLRIMKPGTEGKISGFPVYQQVFQERYGFVANLSLLDLLFAEGPGTVEWLQQHRKEVEKLNFQDG